MSEAIMTAPMLGKQLNDESLSLEQKLALIDQAMVDREAEARDYAVNAGTIYLPPDPANAFACESCQ